VLWLFNDEEALHLLAWIFKGLVDAGYHGNVSFWRVRNRRPALTATAAAASLDVFYAMPNCQFISLII
jgi:hypothetical protein